MQSTLDKQNVNLRYESLNILGDQLEQIGHLPNQLLVQLEITPFRRTTPSEAVHFPSFIAALRTDTCIYWKAYIYIKKILHYVAMRGLVNFCVFKANM